MGQGGALEFPTLQYSNTPLLQSPITSNPAQQELEFYYSSGVRTPFFSVIQPEMGLKIPF